MVLVGAKLHKHSEVKMAHVEEMIRLQVRVPAETRDELTQLADVTGIKMPHFLATSLIIGARQLARQTNPEHFITPGMVRAVLTAMGVDVEGLSQQYGQRFEQAMAHAFDEVQQEEIAASEQRKTA